MNRKVFATINPSEETTAEYKAKKEAFAAEQEELKKLIGVKTVTKSGKRVEVCGNIGKPEDRSSFWLMMVRCRIIRTEILMHG